MRSGQAVFSALLPQAAINRAGPAMGDVFHEDMSAARRELRAPSLPLPAGAYDVHAHVAGPFDRFPMVANAPYRLPLSPYEDYESMLDIVGMAKGVLIQASACGYDNSGLLDALERGNGRLRGVGVVSASISDRELSELDRRGVRGLRFSEVGHPVGAPPPGFLGFAELRRLAPRLKAMGWHAQIWTKCSIIAENAEMFKGLRIPIVFDHFGFIDVSQGTDHGDFRSLVSLLNEGDFWLKTTAFRNSNTLPDMADVRPFHEALVRDVPDRLLWGSDWPFIGMGGNIPNTGHLLDLLREWTADDAIFEKILVTNPRQLYGF
jgi:predicted TIM-barrel fold metal-dependent hydrolase